MSNKEAAEKFPQIEGGDQKMYYSWNILEILI